MRPSTAIFYGCVSVAGLLMVFAGIRLFLKVKIHLRPQPDRPETARPAPRFKTAVAALLLSAFGFAAFIYPVHVVARFVWNGLYTVYKTIEGADAHTQLLFELQSEEFTRGLIAQPKYQDAKRLNKYEAKVFSQGGEDGIISEIFRRVGTTNKIFVEFGAGNGMENNTVLLLREDWSGVWLEADRSSVESIRTYFSREIKAGRLSVYQEFITAENIQALFAKAKVPAEFDLLSIDIDRNDYWVWEKIEQYRPRVVVIEYNAIFPPGIQWIVEYNPGAMWDGSSRAGASLTSLELLGRKKGYKLVGCSLQGVNAFFVRDAFVGTAFCEPFTAQNHYEPPRYFLNKRKLGHPRRP